MLVSKIKPCMSKYKQRLYCETANGSLVTVAMYAGILVSAVRGRVYFG